jgi:cation transport regulator ChaC
MDILRLLLDRTSVRLYCLGYQYPPVYDGTGIQVAPLWGLRWPRSSGRRSTIVRTTPQRPGQRATADQGTVTTYGAGSNYA